MWFSRSKRKCLSNLESIPQEWSKQHSKPNLSGIMLLSSSKQIDLGTIKWPQKIHCPEIFVVLKSSHCCYAGPRPHVNQLKNNSIKKLYEFRKSDFNVVLPIIYNYFRELFFCPVPEGDQLTNKYL